MSKGGGSRCGRSCAPREETAKNVSAALPALALCAGKQSRLAQHVQRKLNVFLVAKGDTLPRQNGVKGRGIEVLMPNLPNLGS